MYSRTIRADGVNAEAGTFDMTLATEGEASDGHILSIEGGEIPERMPLLVSHFNDPASSAGSVVSARKEPKSTPPRLRAVGQVELGGSGPTAEIRRDILHMIERGHIGAVSIRWDSDPGDSVRRVNLPSDHPHFVDASEEPDGSPRRWGMFFEKWRALEGSIVAVGADPGALIGRADELEAEGASPERVAFCRALASDAAGDAAPDPPVEDPGETFAEVMRAEGKKSKEFPVDEDFDLLKMFSEPIPVNVKRLTSKLSKVVRHAASQGLSAADILNAVSDVATEGLRAVELESGRAFLPEAQADEVDALLEARALDTPAVAVPGGDEEPVQDPPARESVEPFDPVKIVRALSAEMDERDRRLRQNFAEILAEATGKVMP